MGYAPRLVFLDRHGLESRSPNEIVEARLSGTPWHTPKADEQGRRKASFRELQAELKRLGFKHLGNVGPIVTRPDLKKAARDKRPEERTQKDFFDSVMWIEERWVKPVQPEPKPVPRTPETNGAMDREARASLLRYIIKA